MKPHFLIIGAAKSGTTSIYEGLKQHPKIQMSSVKEPNFFALEGSDLAFKPGSTTSGYLEECVTDWDQYLQLFHPSNGHKILGEASPIYLYDTNAAKRIHQYIPTAKLIVILRNPIERAYSNFLQHVREGIETTDSFSTAIELEERRLAEKWWWGFAYIKAGFYHQQLLRYTNIFASDQIKIYLYDDFKLSPEDILRDIFQFLDVDPAFTSSSLSTQHNVGGAPQNKALHSFLSKPNPLKEPFKRLLPQKLRKRLVTNLKARNLAKPPLDNDLKRMLTEIYRSDILKLSTLIDRDLSAWLGE